MKKSVTTVVIWIALLLIIGQADSFLSNILVSVTAEEVLTSGAPQRVNYWALLILNSIVFLIAGVVLRERFRSTSSAGISALGLGLTYFFLVELTGGTMFKFLISHGTRLDVLLTYGPLLSPFIFVPLGVYAMDYWIVKKRVS